MEPTHERPFVDTPNKDVHRCRRRDYRECGHAFASAHGVLQSAGTRMDGDSILPVQTFNSRRPSIPELMLEIGRPSKTAVISEGIGKADFRAGSIRPKRSALSSVVWDVAGGSGTMMSSIRHVYILLRDVEPVTLPRRKRYWLALHR
jgi:hypothetical protein